MKAIPKACAAATAAALLGSGGEKVGSSVGLGVRGVGNGVIVGCSDGCFERDGMFVCVGRCVGERLGGVDGLGVLEVGPSDGPIVGKRSM